MSIIYNTLNRLETEGAEPNGEPCSAIPPPAPAPSMGFPVKVLTATMLLLFAGTGLAVWHWSDQLISLKEMALVDTGNPSAQQGSGYQPYPVTRTAAMPVAATRPVVYSEPASSGDRAVPAEAPVEALLTAAPPSVAHESPLRIESDEAQPALASATPDALETPAAKSKPAPVAPKQEPQVAAVAAPVPKPEPTVKAAERAEPNGSAPADRAHAAPAGEPLVVASLKPAVTQTPKAKPRPASTTPRRKPAKAPVTASPEPTRAHKIDQAVEQARIALSRGRYVEALTLLNALDPAPADRADFWLMKGSAHLGLGQLDPAEGAFAAAQPLAPANAQIAVQRAILKQEQGDHAGALQILENAANRHPDVPEVFLNQGYSQQELGAVREAGHSYRIFLRLTEGRSLYTEQRRAVRQWLAQLGKGAGR